MLQQEHDRSNRVQNRTRDILSPSAKPVKTSSETALSQLQQWWLKLSVCLSHSPTLSQNSHLATPRTLPQPPCVILIAFDIYTRSVTLTASHFSSPNSFQRQLSPRKNQLLLFSGFKVSVLTQKYGFSVSAVVGRTTRLESL